MIRICFDFVSPYAYIAWTQIHRIAGTHEVQASPVLFAALLDAHGTLGPAEVEGKRIYTFKDAYRKAHKHGLPPLVPPPSHPFNPLTALRVASLPMKEPNRRKLIDALFAATWATGEGIETPAKIASVANAIGLDGAKLVLSANEPESKDRVRKQTEEAIAMGAFGVPTIFVDGEMFWGVDSLPYLEDRLAGKDPTQDLSLERWKNLPATARRKR